MLIYIILFALLSTYCFYNTIHTKKRKKENYLRQNYAVEQDPIAEYLFDEAEDKIIADTIIRILIISDAVDKEAQIVKYTTEELFKWILVAI